MVKKAKTILGVQKLRIHSSALKCKRERVEEGGRREVIKEIEKAVGRTIYDRTKDRQ